MMSRILLARFTKEMAREPSIGQLRLAAVAAHLGHQVRGEVVQSASELATLLAKWNPEIVGVTLFTESAHQTYEALLELEREKRTWIAGGPHPSLCPEEALEAGFDWVVVGEGERTFASLLDFLTGQAIAPPAGVWWREDGVTRSKGRGALVDDLDTLGFDYEGVGAFNLPKDWMPSGMISSRGCPSQCTFCSNHITGRRFRWRSVAHVIAEVNVLKKKYLLSHLAFWDDAFTAKRSRMLSLARALREAGISWTCITPGHLLRPSDAKGLADAGCVALNIGLESGDPQVLRAVGRNTRLERLVETLRASSDAGMKTIVNIMFGFPEEGPRELDRTLSLIEEVSPWTTFFNARGVLIPYPGTRVYERHHRRFGFTRWWLDSERIPSARMTDPAHDPTLEIDFFQYSREVYARIEEGLKAKAAHNERTLSRLRHGGAR